MKETSEGSRQQSTSERFSTSGNKSRGENCFETLLLLCNRTEFKDVFLEEFSCERGALTSDLGSIFQATVDLKTSSDVFGDEWVHELRRSLYFQLIRNVS